MEYFLKAFLSTVCASECVGVCAFVCAFVQHTKLCAPELCVVVFVFVPIRLNVKNTYEQADKRWRIVAEYSHWGG